MLRKVADGVWWTEDSDGLPGALVTHLEDGTSLRAADQWWTASRAVAATLAESARDLLERYEGPGDQADA